MYHFDMFSFTHYVFKYVLNLIAFQNTIVAKMIRTLVFSPSKKMF